MTIIPLLQGRLFLRRGYNSGRLLNSHSNEKHRETEGASIVSATMYVETGRGFERICRFRRLACSQPKLDGTLLTVFGKNQGAVSNFGLH